jgi:hypothetical protein
LDGREVPIFRNFPNRHPFFEFKIFFNPFLKKIPLALPYFPKEARFRMEKRAAYMGHFCKMQQPGLAHVAQPSNCSSEVYSIF